MSTIERQLDAMRAALEMLPAFELEYAVDDRGDPSTVTVYDPLADDVTTHWLTADIATALDLKDIA